MAKSTKPRKKYRPKDRLRPTVLLHRKLTDAEKGTFRNIIRTTVIQLHLGTAPRESTNTLGTYLVMGYMLALNFEDGENLQQCFKKAAQHLQKCRLAIDRKQPFDHELVDRIEEAANIAIDELCQLDVSELGKLQTVFKANGQRIMDEMLEEVGGNEMVLVPYDELSDEEKLEIGVEGGRVQPASGTIQKDLPPHLE